MCPRANNKRAEAYETRISLQSPTQFCLPQSLCKALLSPGTVSTLHPSKRHSSCLPLYSTMSLGFCQILFMFDLQKVKFVSSYELMRNLPFSRDPGEIFNNPLHPCSLDRDPNVIPSPSISALAWATLQKYSTGSSSSPLSR